MKILSALSLGSLCLASVAMLGCAAAAEVVDGLDSTDAAASSAQMSHVDHMLLGPVTTPDASAAANAVVTAKEWWPAGCATREKDATNPAVAYVHLKDCTGPFGLVKWTGDVTIVFSVKPGGTLHAEGSSKNMTINGKEATWSRSADVVISGNLRTITGSGAWTRMNGRGEIVSHTSAAVAVIDVGTRCGALNGSGQSKFGTARSVDAVATDYKICRKVDGTNSCPTGKIVFTSKPSGKTHTVTFDGTAKATLTYDKGTLSLPLVCTP